MLIGGFSLKSSSISCLVLFVNVDAKTRLPESERYGGSTRTKILFSTHLAEEGLPPLLGDYFVAVVCRRVELPPLRWALKSTSKNSSSTGNRVLRTLVVRTLPPGRILRPPNAWDRLFAHYVTQRTSAAASRISVRSELHLEL